MESENHNRLLIEAGLEAIEAIVDTFSEQDVWTELPVVSTVFKSLRASNTIREKIFANKIFIFFEELNRASDSKRKQLKDKILNSPQEAKEVGRILLMVLDKVTDLDKPKLLAKLFIAFLDEVISKEDMRRLIYAVEIAFIDDLHGLIRNGAGQNIDLHLQFLVSSGLSHMAGGWDTGYGYEKTILADKLLQAYSHVDKNSNS